jgi:hypothetical protein
MVEDYMPAAVAAVQQTVVDVLFLRLSVCGSRSKRLSLPKTVPLSRPQVTRKFGCPWMPTDDMIRWPALRRAGLKFELVRVPLRVDDEQPIFFSSHVPRIFSAMTGPTIPHPKTLQHRKECRPRCFVPVPDRTLDPHVYSRL